MNIIVVLPRSSQRNTTSPVRRDNVLHRWDGFGVDEMLDVDCYVRALGVISRMSPRSNERIRLCEQCGRPSGMKKYNRVGRIYDSPTYMINHSGHRLAGVDGIEEDPFGAC
jgi:hypothetical protein